jgi:hypothetical protein
MKKRFGMVIGWLSLTSFVGCGGVAHSLGGKEAKQNDNPGTGGTESSAQPPSMGNSGGAPSRPAATADDAAAPTRSSGGTTSAGTGGAGAPLGSAPASCGPCEDVMREGYRFAGCCLADGTCGVDASFAAEWAGNSDRTLGISGGCQPRDQLGVPDGACNSQQAGVDLLPGCCRPDGTCGVDLDILHLGCVQAVALPYLGNDAGAQPTLASLETCHYSPPLPEDAGR